MGISMLAKLTSKNQLTLPKALISLFPGTTYFEVSEEEGRIVLTPVRLQQGDAVRAKLAELGIDAKDVRDAVRWARGGK
jgi:multisubunit Na+/H+ antiporter MnhE subunit